MEFFKKQVCLATFKLFKKHFVNSNVIGLGSGSTIKYLIDIMASTGVLRDKAIYASSLDTLNYLYDRGFEAYKPLDNPNVSIDIYIDGFDEASLKLDLIKGRGGAFYWEKLLASRSKLRVYVGDYTKLNNRYFLYLTRIPVEVKPEALRRVLSFFSNKGFNPVIRKGGGKVGFVTTDSGNFIIDIRVERIDDAEFFDKEIKVEGVVETGLFPSRLVEYLVLSGPQPSCIRVLGKVG